MIRPISVNQGANSLKPVYFDLFPIDKDGLELVLAITDQFGNPQNRGHLLKIDCKGMVSLCSNIDPNLGVALDTQGRIVISSDIVSSDDMKVTKAEKQFVQNYNRKPSDDQELAQFIIEMEVSGPIRTYAEDLVNAADNFRERLEEIGYIRG